MPESLIAISAKSAPATSPREAQAPDPKTLESRAQSNTSQGASCRAWARARAMAPEPSTASLVREVDIPANHTLSSAGFTPRKYRTLLLAGEPPSRGQSVVGGV